MEYTPINHNNDKESQSKMDTIFVTNHMTNKKRNIDIRNTDTPATIDTTTFNIMTIIDTKSISKRTTDMKNTDTETNDRVIINTMTTDTKINPMTTDMKIIDMMNNTTTPDDKPRDALATDNKTIAEMTTVTPPVP